MLFVCVHNAGRSQLAAGLAAAYAGGRVNVLSAGTTPDAAVSPVMVASLAELGIDRSDQVPTQLTDELLRRADVVVALKAGLGIRCARWRRSADLGPAQPRRLGRRQHPALYATTSRRRVQELIDQLVDAGRLAALHSR